MTRIIDLLAGDFSRPVEENVSIDDPAGLAGYVTTDGLKAEYERVFSAIAAAIESPGVEVGIRIAGFFGSGRTSFAKMLGCVLAGREVDGLRKSAVPYEVFAVDMKRGGAGGIATLLDGAEDPSANGSVRRCFDLCEVRHPGKSFAWLLDDADDIDAESLYDLVEEVGRQSVERVRAGRIPGPAWVVVTTRESGDVANARERLFRTRIDLSEAGLREVVARRLLRKKPDGESALRRLFRECGASLNRNIQTACDEDGFVRYYPYPPHLIDLSMELLAGLRRQPNASKYLDSSNRTLVKQVFEMLVSEQTGIAGMPVGALVSIDKIYPLVEGNIPWEKQKSVLDIRQRFDDHPDYPGMASRVARAICLMDLAGPRVPRTIGNIAALLIQRTSEDAPVAAVEAILERLDAAQFVRRTGHGGKICDFDDLRRAAASLRWIADSVGVVNPRGAGWHNRLAQFGKKSMARLLGWYTRPLREFSASVARSLGDVVEALDQLSRSELAEEHLLLDAEGMERRVVADKRAPQLLDHLAINAAAVDRLTIDTAALQERLALSERKIELLRTQLGQAAELEGAGRKFDRTAYILGLFGTGRRYINNLIVENIGERARYFHDTIRLHPGPTPMIYSGHATIKYLCRQQETPAVMSRIQEAVAGGFADSIFIYRHPLDSLLTNWVWWRTWMRENRSISGLSQIYKSNDDLCAGLEENFPEFQAFAEGDPEFFAGVPGPGFLSFSEFVEETELHIGSATLALRLEDFLADARGGFSRIAGVLGVAFDADLFHAPPAQTAPYRYRTVVEKVPRLARLIEGLDVETSRRIERIGYRLL